MLPSATISGPGGPLGAMGGGAPPPPRPQALVSTMQSRCDLQGALDDMCDHEILFLNKYKVTSVDHQAAGGQGMVQFMECVHDKQQVAVKFFFELGAYDREQEVYAQLRDKRPPVTPQLRERSRNDNPQSQEHVRGKVLPPFLIMDKGESMREVVRKMHGGGKSVTWFRLLPLLVELLNHVQVLHESNLVHRDLKPENIVYMPKDLAWYLIDFGTTVNADSDAALQYTLPYAPPELIAGLGTPEVGRKCAKPCTDMWAVGIIAYELLTNCRWWDGLGMEEAMQRLVSPGYMPWEATDPRVSAVDKLGSMKHAVMACLSRDPSRRPSARQLLQEINGIWANTQPGNVAPVPTPVQQPPGPAPNSSATPPQTGVNTPMIHGSGPSAFDSTISSQSSGQRAGKAKKYYRTNDASAGEITDQIVAHGSFKDVKLGLFTSGPRAGEKFVAKFMRGVDPYLSSVYDFERRIVKDTHAIIQRFQEQGLAPLTIFVNKPQLWQGAAAGTQWQAMRHLVEPYIEGYMKFNSNTGWVTRKELGAVGDALQALSHFSYHDSGGELVLCDLQGGHLEEGLVLTDPVLMSKKRTYGPTDLGKRGVQDFFNHHRCTQFCKAEWLRPKLCAPSKPRKGTVMMDSSGSLMTTTLGLSTRSASGSVNTIMGRTAASC